jgi:hypothetical protein
LVKDQLTKHQEHVTCGILAKKINLKLLST